MGGSLLSLHWFVGLIGAIASTVSGRLFQDYAFHIACAAAILLAAGCVLVYFSEKK